MVEEVGVGIHHIGRVGEEVGIGIHQMGRVGEEVGYRYPCM